VQRGANGAGGSEPPVGPPLGAVETSGEAPLEAAPAGWLVASWGHVHHVQAVGSSPAQTRRDREL
jgi:hypothetical protein